METHGGVAQRYLQIGATTSWLGFPTSGEVPVLGGVRQHFAGGYMWWISAAGAWETHGGINVRFLQIYNVASGLLGFPTSGEVAVAGGVRQTFQGGSIWWSSPSGAWETHGAIGDEYLRGSGASGWYGFPVSPEYSYYGGRRQDYQHGSILWNVQPVLDATYAPVTKADVWASWRPGCPVGPESLTLIRMNYWGFDNAVHRGELHRPLGPRRARRQRLRRGARLSPADQGDVAGGLVRGSDPDVDGRRQHLRASTAAR